MNSRLFATTALTLLLGGAMFLASHSLTDQRVSAASRAQVTPKAPAPTQAQPLQHTRPGVTPAAPQTIKPVTPNGILPGAAEPAGANTPQSAPRLLTHQHIDPGTRQELLNHRSDPAKRKELCRRLEQRREELKNEKRHAQSQN